MSLTHSEVNADVTLQAYHPPPYDEAGCPVKESDYENYDLDDDFAGVVVLDNYRLFTRPKGRFQPSVYPNVISQDFQRGHDELLSLKVLTLADGGVRLIAGGYASHAAYSGVKSQEDFLLVRYFPVGIIDRRFATEGFFIRDFAGGADRIRDIQPLNDGTGRFLVVGSASNAARVSTGDKATGKDMVLMLFSQDGQPDHSFGDNGVVIRDINQGDDELLAAVLLQVDDQWRIMAAGYASGVTGDTNHKDRILLAYTLAGQPVGQCGEQGYTTGSDPGDDEFRTLQLLTLPGSSHRILAAGYKTLGDSQDFLMASFRDNCELDSDFGHHGEVIRNRATEGFGESYNHNDTLGAIRVVQNGDYNQILTAGISQLGPPHQLVLSRYWSNGTLDETFGTGGDVLLGVYHPFEEPLTLEVIALDNGEQQIIAGKYGRPFCDADNSVLVSMPVNGNGFNETLLEGSLETDFFHFGEASAAVRGIVNVTLSDGSRHLIAAGYGFGATGTDCACTTQNDLMLTSFGIDGEQSLCFGASETVLRQTRGCADLLADLDAGDEIVSTTILLPTLTMSTTLPTATPQPPVVCDSPHAEQENDNGAIVGLSVALSLSLVGNAATIALTGYLLCRPKFR